MAATAWKSFRFWDVTSINLPDNEAFQSVQGSSSCVVASADHVIVGNPDGSVRLLDQSFRTTHLFPAHDNGNITHIEPIPDTSCIVTLAEDLSHEPELKVWALDKLDKKTGLPQCLSSTSVQNGKRQFPVSAMAVLADLNQIAVGFANGSVTIVKGDFIHDRGTRQRTVFESDQPITGLEFWEGPTTVLVISTTDRISNIVVGKRQTQAANFRNQSGCALGCMAKNAGTGNIYVARNEHISVFSRRSDQPQKIVYHGEKKLIKLFKDHILLVTPPQDSAAQVPLRSFATDNADDLFSTTSFVILDPDLKVIAHSEALSSQIRTIFCVWDSVFLLTQDGKLLRYREKPLLQRVEILLQREHFLLAILTAQRDKLDPKHQEGIFRRYGDHLYEKGDYDTAMQQYLRAMDDTEPSQIIRKYLDTRRIDNLIEYLEELHQQHKAASEHTALLLNCYAKLKDVHKLQDFIKSRDELTCDLDTTIAMCRQCGYSDQAAFLARKYNEHALVVEILVEDLKKYAEALAYIWRLQPAEAYSNATQFGTVLLLHEPKDTTQFFIDYCTGVFMPKKDAVVTRQVPANQTNTGENESEGFGLTTRATTAVQNLAALIPLPQMSIDVFRSSSGADQVTRQEIIETTVEDTFVEYTVPNVRNSFAPFADHPLQFIAFLEACIESDAIQGDRGDLYTSLFELYLEQAAIDVSDKAAWSDKAKKLVEKHNSVMGTTNVLLISHLCNFPEGTTLVREQRGLYFDMFRSYTSAKDTAGAIQALRKYGPLEPKLYPSALTYFTSSAEILKEAGNELDIVLKRIDQDGLMAPLQIIQALSQSQTATMGLIKPYLSKIVERERGEIASNRNLVKSYRQDTEMKRQEMYDLENKSVSFSATRCSLCGTPLDLPVVHFMCKHSFHQRCLGVSGLEIGEHASGAGRDGTGDDNEGQDDGSECPKCAPQNETIKAIKRGQDECARRHDLFLDALGKSTDGFGTIGEWLGRGVMNASIGTVE